jgi:ArsR family transcriptional regulator
MHTPSLQEIYRCLGDETRLRIVHLLAQAPLCVCHLQDILGLTQVAASKHLALLRRSGLVESRRHEQWMIYSLPNPRPRELDWQLRCLQDCLSTYPRLREDLKKLGTVNSECGWVTELVPTPPAIAAIAVPVAAPSASRARPRTTARRLSRTPTRPT